MVEGDLNRILEQGSIIDNRRVGGAGKVTLLDILRNVAENSEGLKCAVGYLYLEGLALLIDRLRSLKEIKILMGTQTTKLTKQELIKAFTESLDKIPPTEENASAIALFHSLVKDAKTLQVLAYFGDGSEVERLHSKAYLFLRNTQTRERLDRYKAGIVGSSNLTPSGLVGNTELNVILTDPKDLSYLESWFDELWALGSKDFDRLVVHEALVSSIEASKFAKALKERFVYLAPRDFFKILIGYMKADYLFEDWSKSRLLGFQRLDAIRSLRLFNEKANRGVFLTSSVGLGKSYEACQIGKYFIRGGGRVLLVAPSGLIEDEEQWPRYLRESDLFHKVDMLGMGLLQKDPQDFDSRETPKYEREYSLIIVDEAHNYRNEDAYRTRNLKSIIDRNGDARILFLTATPINTSLDDLLNLIRLFHRPGRNLQFDRLFRELTEIVKTLSETPYENLTKSEKMKLEQIQKELELELFVKSTRSTIKASQDYLDEIKTLTGVDISQIPDPDVHETVYTLDKKYKEIVNHIVDFISSLSAAHLRIVDPEKGARLGAFFKWVLYKRFESDISSYYLTLKRMLRKNRLIRRAIEERNVSVLEEEPDDESEEISVAFDIQYRRKIAEVIQKIEQGVGHVHLEVLKDLEADADKIEKQIRDLEFFRQDQKGILFIDDRKLSELLEIIRRNSSSKILVFTEYRDTLRAISQFLAGRFKQEEIKFVDSNTKGKTTVLSRFNNPDDSLRILVTTDTLSEGFNIGGADLVIDFDIPYNPVRLIQRIGRATRLDKPKKIRVLNFRPDEDIDRELDLVERLQLRIEDIIRFVGLEYRIWFEREAELLKERRKFDLEVYRQAALEILKGVRQDMWKGEFASLEVQVPYTNPVLALMQKAIQGYAIKKEDLGGRITHNSYTLLKGKKDLAVFYGESKVFGENAVQQASLEEPSGSIVFEREFAEQLSRFKQHLEKEKTDAIVISYYTDKMDRMTKSIIELIDSKHYAEQFQTAGILRKELTRAKEMCGARTGRVIREIQRALRSEISEKVLANGVQRLRDSYTRKVVQEKLVVEERPYLALGFLE